MSLSSYLFGVPATFWGTGFGHFLLNQVFCKSASDMRRRGRGIILRIVSHRSHGFRKFTGEFTEEIRGQDTGAEFQVLVLCEVSPSKQHFQVVGVTWGHSHSASEQEKVLCLIHKSNHQAREQTNAPSSLCFCGCFVLFVAVIDLYWFLRNTGDPRLTFGHILKVFSG